MDRCPSWIDVFAMAIGVMVGWGAFVMPGAAFLPIAGNGVCLSEALVSVTAFAVAGLLFVKAKPFLLAAGVPVAAVCVPHAISSGACRDYGTAPLRRGCGVFTLVILAL